EPAAPRSVDTFTLRADCDGDGSYETVLVDRAPPRNDGTPNRYLFAPVGNAVPGVPVACVGALGRHETNSPRLESQAGRTISVGRATYNRLAPIVGALMTYAFSLCLATARGALRAMRTIQSRDHKLPRRRLRVVGGVSVMLLSGIVLFIVTGKGTVRIEINDPAIEVVVDGTSATVKGATSEPIELRAGVHVLRIKYRELDFETNKFTLNRGDTVTLKVELLPGMVRAASGEVALGERPLLAIAPFDTEHATALQEAWAKHLGTEVTITNSLGMKLRLIPPGEFLMGTDQAEIRKLLRSTREDFANEAPQHRVRLTNAFYLASHPVTLKQYHEVMGVQPLSYGYSWFDAVDFCNELSDHEGLPAYYLRQDEDDPLSEPPDSGVRRTGNGKNVTVQGGSGYRFPTEAEWEFACRAGTLTRWWFGGEDQKFAEYWRDVLPDVVTRTPGRSRANPFGLFDLLTGGGEWCWDWYGAYSAAEENDPIGPARGKERVTRGRANRPRSATRTYIAPASDHGFFGFRVARTYP
ncbi:MAG TPA: formylglycine-generating enzyme family protein, partial [Pirellulales bacterium]|nr:formylglycine-generating enzyme family protein [Pirellulales bacterium]